MKKNYIMPQQKTSNTDILDSFMEWISQGPDTGVFDTKQREDAEQDPDTQNDFGNLW